MASSSSCGNQETDMSSSKCSTAENWLSSVEGALLPPDDRRDEQVQNGAEIADRSIQLPSQKLAMVFSLLSMLSTQSRRESTEAFLRMSREPDQCALMRQSGCLTLIVRLLHPSDSISLLPDSEDLDIFDMASETLRNVVAIQKDSVVKDRETKILRCVEQTRMYVLHLRFESRSISRFVSCTIEKETLTAVVSLMKWSFEEENRSTTCLFGGLEAICDALVMDQQVYGATPSESHLLLRKYIGMTLTNLSYGSAQSKRLLCGNVDYLKAISSQLQSTDDLKQVYASVLRNLSWKADQSSKIALKVNRTGTLLVVAALGARKETTIKSILSALWNITSHCEENQSEVCEMPSAIEFLATTLKSSWTSGNTAIVENCGGILRNISACIGVRDDLRQILRRKGCLELLVEQLEAENPTVVSNACGTLWSLALGCPRDQKALCQLDAIPLLKKLSESKHALIRLGSMATLKILHTFCLSQSSPSNRERFCSTEFRKCSLSQPTSRDRTPVRGPLSSSNSCGKAAGDSCSADEGSATSSSSSSARLMGRFPVRCPIEDTDNQSSCRFNRPSPLSPCSTTNYRPLAPLDRGTANGQPTETIQLEEVKENCFGVTVSSREGGEQRRQESMETLKRFAVEGTPIHLSRRSSLNSLQAVMFQEEQPYTDKTAKIAITNQANACVLSPMMFSRHSSVESLNSCELHSVHSTVYSEYSCYPTALVSPSDIPDSPNQSVMPSPFPNNDKTLEKNTEEDDIDDDSAVAVINDSEAAPNAADCDDPSTLIVDDVFDQPRVYQNEGSSRGGLSSASSLSALTVDVDTKLKPTSVCDMYDLRSCIRSAQPSKPQSVKHLRVSPYAPPVEKGVMVKEDDDPSKSYFIAYDKKDSAGAYDPTDEIVRRYADEGSEVPGIQENSQVIKNGVLPQSDQVSTVPEEPNPSPPSIQPEMDPTSEISDVSVADIHSLISMAMPKPKSSKLSARHVDTVTTPSSKGPIISSSTSFAQKKLVHRKENTVTKSKQQAMTNEPRVVEGRTTLP
ncbi:Adenomatous polyposis coli protein [Trichuris trichiura]|uniref:Adenomatous polyposis coli protein n=1 Tax=Trichuris trichiura TaxID=36087 RepID=A0A077ZMW9_TRITR|nr:Adenomatous polyposis coli protein [Trichuris trichiura]